MAGTHFSGPVVVLDRTLADVTQSPGIFVGNGSPQGVLTAPKGSLYLNEGGSGTANRVFINTDGTNNWTAITTAT